MLTILLICPRDWQEALRISFSHRRDDRISEVKNASLEYSSMLVSEYDEGLEKVGKYFTRYLAVRQRRLLLAAKIQSYERSVSELDDETASQASSNFCGMSAYTTGTRKSSTASFGSSMPGKARDKRRQRNKGKIRRGRLISGLEVLLQNWKDSARSIVGCRTGLEVNFWLQNWARSVVAVVVLLGQFPGRKRVTRLEKRTPMSNIFTTSGSQSRVLRRTTPSNPSDGELNFTQFDSKPKNKQVHWTEDMDKILITSLLHQAVGSTKKCDNGFTSVQVSKAVDSVFTGLGVVVTVNNVRARLKSLKKEYVEIHQLLVVSGFVLDPLTGRVTADPIAWEQLVNEKPEFDKWKTKLCLRYDELEALFGNDGGTGDRAVTGFNDFSPINLDENVNEMEPSTEDTDPSPTSSKKRNVEEKSNKVKRRRALQVDENVHALATIVESSKEIANALKVQATLDTLNHVNWPLILQKLQGMGLDDNDVVQLMKKFHTDQGLGVMFMSFTNESLTRKFVFMKLGRDPPHE